eukprot:9766425-Ditylum_brightwellii.AAC.1
MAEFCNAIGCVVTDVMVHLGDFLKEEKMGEGEEYDGFLGEECTVAAAGVDDIKNVAEVIRIFAEYNCR